MERGNKRTTIWGKYGRTIDSRGISLKIEIIEQYNIRNEFY